MNNFLGGSMYRNKTLGGVPKPTNIRYVHKSIRNCISAFCCYCNFPFNSKIRLNPCYHIICGKCYEISINQQICLVCNNFINDFEELFLNSPIYICPYEDCKKGFINERSFNYHKYFKHSMLNEIEEIEKSKKERREIEIEIEKEIEKEKKKKKKKKKKKEIKSEDEKSSKLSNIKANDDVSSDSNSQSLTEDESESFTDSSSSNNIIDKENDFSESEIEKNSIQKKIEKKKFDDSVNIQEKNFMDKNKNVLFHESYGNLQNKNFDKSEKNNIDNFSNRTVTVNFNANINTNINTNTNDNTIATSNSNDANYNSKNLMKDMFDKGINNVATGNSLKLPVGNSYFDYTLKENPMYSIPTNFALKQTFNIPSEIENSNDNNPSAIFDEHILKRRKTENENKGIINTCYNTGGENEFKQKGIQESINNKDVYSLNNKEEMCKIMEGDYTEGNNQLKIDEVEKMKGDNNCKETIRYTEKYVGTNDILDEFTKISSTSLNTAPIISNDWNNLQIPFKENYNNFNMRNVESIILDPKGTEHMHTTWQTQQPEIQIMKKNSKADITILKEKGVNQGEHINHEIYTQQGNFKGTTNNTDNIDDMDELADLM